MGMVHGIMPFNHYESEVPSLNVINRVMKLLSMLDGNMFPESTNSLESIAEEEITHTH